MSKKIIRISIILTVFSSILVLLLYVAPREKSPSELIIYDVHSNSPRVVKEDGTIDNFDYLRIKNATNQPYDLTGLFLSDSRKKFDKLPLDGIVIEGGDSVMIKPDPSWNFGLNSAGNESVYLTDSKGNIIFKYDPERVPNAPILSEESGFYDKEFELRMQSRDGYPIYYTLDGSEPGMDSNLYISPIRVFDRSGEPNRVVNVVNTIRNYLEEEHDGVPVEKPIDTPVDKAFIVRAAAIDEYGNKSDIVTREYFFCGDRYRNVMSVVADPIDLFGDYGILSVGKDYDEWYLNGKEGEEPSVNYKQKGRNWEIPADMVYFRNNEMVLQQKCGLKLQGRTTRDRRIKNFQLRARRCYSGSDVFDYDFFENESFRSDGVILDDSFEESLFCALVENEDIIKQKTTDRVALFVNGEFWNNIYIHQKLDERYFADHFNVPEDNLLVMSESLPEIGAKTDEEYEEARNYYFELSEFAADNDLAVEKNYQEIQKMIDIDSYIDYLAINIWAGNTDWGENENDMYWRVKIPNDEPLGDGRFRWILHDGDYVFNEGVFINSRFYIEQSVLHINLMDNSHFRESLAARLRELGETSFSEENIRNTLEDPRWDEPDTVNIKEYLLDRRSTIEDMIENQILNYQR